MCENSIKKTRNFSLGYVEASCEKQGVQRGQEGVVQEAPVLPLLLNTVMSSGEDLLFRVCFPLKPSLALLYLY